MMLYRNLSLSKSLLNEKGHKFAQLFKLNDFVCIGGLFDIFKTLHKIVFFQDVWRNALGIADELFVHELQLVQRTCCDHMHPRLSSMLTKLAFSIACCMIKQCAYKVILNMVKCKQRQNNTLLTQKWTNLRYYHYWSL